MKLGIPMFGMKTDGNDPQSWFLKKAQMASGQSHYVPVKTLVRGTGSIQTWGLEGCFNIGLMQCLKSSVSIGSVGKPNNRQKRVVMVFSSHFG